MTPVELALLAILDGQKEPPTTREERRAAAVELRWLLAIAQTCRAAGIRAPSDDELLLCGIDGSLACGSEFSKQERAELLAARPFLEHTTEQAMRAELARVKGLR